MSKYAKPGKADSKKARQEWPLVVYIGIIGLGFAGYIIARIALDGQPHPLHWVSGLAGAVLGYFVGWLWYHWRGDII
jgi:hypothetical protein